MRKLLHRLALAVENPLDSRSLSCERIRAKDRVIESVHRRQGPPVVTLVRKRGHSPSCVVGMLSRIMVTVVHRSEI